MRDSQLPTFILVMAKGTGLQLKDEVARTEDEDGLLSFQSELDMGKRLKFTPEGGFPRAPKHQSQFT